MQLMLVFLALVLGTAAAQGATRPYTQLLESKPVRVNGAEFVALAEADWVAFNPPHGRWSGGAGPRRNAIATIRLHGAICRLRRTHGPDSRTHLS